MGVSDDAVLVEQARSIAAQLDGRWFADFDELCGFAEILAAAGFLVSPVDVVEFFRRPWRQRFARSTTSKARWFCLPMRERTSAEAEE